MGVVDGTTNEHTYFVFYSIDVFLFLNEDELLYAQQALTKFTASGVILPAENSLGRGQRAVKVTKRLITTDESSTHKSEANEDNIEECVLQQRCKVLIFNFKLMCIINRNA